MEAQKTTRNNFKQQYINSITHDLQYCEECVAGQKLIVWWHGKRYSKNRMRNFAREIKEELAKIAADKTYKPWK